MTGERPPEVERGFLVLEYDLRESRVRVWRREFYLTEAEAITAVDGMRGWTYYVTPATRVKP